MDIREQKRALRAKMREIRHKAYETIPQAATALRDNFLSNIKLPEKTSVSAYAAIDEEIDPMPLVIALAEKGHEVCLPVVVAPGEPLIFRAYSPGDELIKGTGMNVGEPIDKKPEVIPSVILIPLLAFDHRGYRLGYGGGYYDRTIALLTRNNPSVRAFGLAFSAQEVPTVPTSKYDRKLNGIITETGAILAF